MNSFFAYRSARAAHAVAILFMLQSFAHAAQKTAATSPVAGTDAVAPDKKIVETGTTNTTQKAVADFGIEYQWRPSADPSLFPLLLVYLTNHSETAVEWQKVFLNQKEVTSGHTDEVMYAQFYPAAQAQPGETVELQVSMVAIPRADQMIEIKTKDGRTVKTSVAPFSHPVQRINGLAFSSDYQRLFLTYTSQQEGDAPQKVMVNGADCAGRMQVWESPQGERPGLMSVSLPQATAAGRPIHVRLEFNGDLSSSFSQCLVRGYRGISLDSFGLTEAAKDLPTRHDLGLDAKPLFCHLYPDPACDDIATGSFMGRSIPAVLSARAALYASAPDRMGYHHQCTAAANRSFSLYGYCTDALAVNRYCLHWDSDVPCRFIEEEEISFRHAWQAAQPHPWGWLPEAFVCMPNTRMLEPEELRILSFGAIGYGIKAVNYFVYGGLPGIVGFEKSPALLAEIKKLNADLKKLEPWLGGALPLSREIVGTKENGMCVSTLWAGDSDSLVVVVRNLDYKTDRESNDFGKKSRFVIKPKEKVQVSILKPSWLTVGEVSDALTGQNISSQVENELIHLDAGTVELGKIFLVKNKIGDAK